MNAGAAAVCYVIAYITVFHTFTLVKNFARLKIGFKEMKAENIQKHNNYYFNE